MTRMFQDYNFSVDQVENSTATRLLGSVYDNDPDHQPCVVFLKTAGSTGWHRFFLQAQIGFWEFRSDATTEEEFDECFGDDGRLVDYGDWIGGMPQTLSKAYANECDKGCTEIHLNFLDGNQFRLLFESADLDAGFTVEATTWKKSLTD